jgi:hypothetical protein
VALLRWYAIAGVRASITAAGAEAGEGARFWGVRTSYFFTISIGVPLLTHS